MKKLLMGTNLKMYKTAVETAKYLGHLQALTEDLRDEVTMFVIPSFVALPDAARAVKESAVMIGAQNMHPEEQGQYTGEVSPLMLKELKINIVEIGHSERRHVFNESDVFENQKVLSALSHGFIALLCVGETAEQKEYNITDEVLRMQLKVGLHGVRHEYYSRIWVAYEPVWAIGVKGIPATPEYVEEKHRLIRKTLQEICPESNIPLLYGGSVNFENASSIIVCNCVDGLFVGRTAWNADGFNRLIRQVLPEWKGKTHYGQ